MSGQSLIIKPESNYKDVLACMSPIGRLPLELLHIIFDIARRTHSSMIPFTLSHVCRQWRSLLLASPSFWSAIVIQRPLSNFQYQTLWLNRSQRRDLSINIQFLANYLTSKEYETLRQIICLTNFYWKEIEVSCDSDRAALAIMAWLHLGSLPKLTAWLDAELGVARHAHTNIFTLDPEWFSACEHLRQLHFTYHQDPAQPTRLGLLYRIVQGVSARLEDLWVYIPESYHAGQSLVIDEIPIEVISLPRLIKLNLSWGINNHMGYFLIPFLRRIYAPNVLTAKNIPISALTETKELSYSRGMKHLGLTSNRYYNAAFTEDMIPPFLKAFSHLISLRSVQFTSIQWHDGEFATALLNSCPQLIRVRFLDCSSMQDKDLRRLVEGRKVSKDVAPLYYLVMFDCEVTGLDEDARAWFGERLELFEYDSRL